MSKSNVRNAFGSDARRFTDHRPRRCTWGECEDHVVYSWPVCLSHGLAIYEDVRDLYKIIRDSPEGPDDKHVELPVRRDPHATGAWVYYLMLSPTVVKIGTTRRLVKRISQLRTDLAYVVAIEPGSHDIETRRHRQFREERLGRREDFRLSERLKQHIELLQPERDELIKRATAA